MVRLFSLRALGAHLVLIAAIASCAWLSDWQLDVWRTERAQAASDHSAHAPVPLGKAIGADAVLDGANLGRPVIVQGSWMPITIYVADRENKSRVGYWVVSPVKVASTGSAMLVVRGWAPSASAPDLNGSVEVQGWLQAGEGSHKSDPDPTDKVLPELRIATAVQHVPADLYGAYVVASAPTDGLQKVTEHDVPPVSSTTGLRNLLYGLQWWVFAAFAVYVWGRWCRDEVRAGQVG